MLINVVTGEVMLCQLRTSKIYARLGHVRTVKARLCQVRFG
jgi:hypothetical protein